MNMKRIRRELLVFLRKIDMRDRNICNLLGVSRTSLYTYLKENPITEDEFNSINTDRDNLIGYFWQYIINNRVNQPQNTNFRLPEKGIKENRQPEKIEVEIIF